ncbi:MAG: RagB/SusD family nutrient uptake outer membrane protein [Duncaniella sp.]|nr:RagB/SusD family nutrient uptake outer membrane protein [Duncaniella sp.]
MKLKIKTIIASLAMALSLSSCEDFFELKPTNEMVLDEFWQTESDVLSVTGACYRAMQQPDFMQRLMVWGEFRSDNVILGNNMGADLLYVGVLNTLPSNGYAYWGNFYNVINLCNTVERFAPQVCEKDPNFTPAQLRAYIAEVKAIRAFCYFTLVRTFRDVPLITEPTVDDTQDLQCEQADPDELLDFLIDDLKAVENDAVASWTSTEYTKGRFTRAGVRALLADMCLWRNRYTECIDYCDAVMSDPDNILTLVGSNAYNRSVFVDGNSSESIFELQFVRNNIPNYTLCEFYGTEGGHSGWGHQQMMAYDFSTTSLFEPTDIRGIDSFYSSSSLAAFPIKKYLAYRNEIHTTNVRESDYISVDGGAANWIVYRLPDVMLMKAEALVEKGERLEEAFRLVSAVYDRANPEAGAGSLSFSSYGTQDRMRDLVFDERQRELLFEGKRYFDILRRINRDRSQFQNIVNTYLIPKYSSLDQSTVSSKLSEINALYMPIKDSELRSNKLLKQNPFYKVSSSIEKN